MHPDEEITVVARAITMRELVFGVDSSDGVPIAVEVDARTEPVLSAVALSL